MTTFKWGVAGLKGGAGNLYDGYASWLNRKVIWAEDTTPNNTWDNVETEKWFLQPWSDWVNAVPGRRLVLSVPIIPGGWDGKGTTGGTGANVPLSLEDGAKGLYNDHYRKLAENLVKYKLGNSVLRLGWEWTGSWYAWRANNAEKAEAFAGYFRQIVTTMRAVPGAENLKFDWNVAMVWIGFPIEKAWPGDDVVDYVGVDVYDDSWMDGTYPLPKDATPEEAAARRDKVWKDLIQSKAKFGLPFWVEFAAKHGKPLTIPEWGVDNRKDGHSGLDDPAYVERMYRFIQDPANNVYYHGEFDVQAGDGHHQLSPNPDGTVVTEFPNAAAKFKELYALPPG